MKTRFNLLAMAVGLLLVFAVMAMAADQAPVTEQVKKYHVMNYVVVTPDGPSDGGDFGPNTPGTKTSGIQEALDYAAKNSNDVYISGGGFGPGATRGVGYTLHETLRVPWRQNARIDGGEYWLGYDGTSGDAVVIDSQMNCYIKFGLVVASRSPGAVVRLYPTTKGPDKLCCLVASTLEFNGMVGAGDVWGKPGAIQKGTGLYMDSTKGGIGGNKIFIYEINACEKGVVMTQGTNENNIEITWSHLTTVGMQIGSAEAPGVSGNKISGGFSCGLPGGVGLQVFGQNNYFFVQLSAHDPGKNIILEAPARDNYFFAVTMPQGITNNASHPTNRIVTTLPVGYTVGTPPVPKSGEEIVNRNPYTIEISIMTPGKLSGWTETDANGTSHDFKAGLTVGQRFIMDPGDKLKLTYDEAPTWVWKALR